MTGGCLPREWAQEMIDSGDIRVLSAYQLLIEEIRKNHGNDTIFVSPGKYDRTSMPRMDTRRLGLHRVKVESVPDLAGVEGMAMCVLDDIIYGGSTAEQSAITLS